MTSPYKLQKGDLMEENAVENVHEQQHWRDEPRTPWDGDPTYIREEGSSINRAFAQED